MTARMPNDRDLRRSQPSVNPAFGVIATIHDRALRPLAAWGPASARRFCFRFGAFLFIVAPAREFGELGIVEPETSAAGTKQES